MRCVFFPFLQQEIIIDSRVKASISNSPTYHFGNRKFHNDVAFRGLVPHWRPVLRGQKLETYRDGPDGRMKLAAKRIKEDGSYVVDFAIRSLDTDSGEMFLQFEWLVGLFAEVCRDIMSLIDAVPTLSPGVFRVGIHSKGACRLNLGDHVFGESYVIPEQLIFIPDFPINTPRDLAPAFEQLQRDILSLAGEEFSNAFSLDVTAETTEA